MADKKLTREEIALSILNGIIATLSPPDQLGSVFDLFSDVLGEKTGQKLCAEAFKMADLFIKERDNA